MEPIEMDCKTCDYYVKKECEGNKTPMYCPCHLMVRTPKWKDCVGKKVVLMDKQAGKPFEVICKVLELMENGAIARVLWDDGGGMPIGFIHTKMTGQLPRPEGRGLRLGSIERVD